MFTISSSLLFDRSAYRSGALTRYATWSEALAAARELAKTEVMVAIFKGGLKIKTVSARPEA